MATAKAAPAAAQAFGFGTPFEAQIAYLRNKLALPTDKWDDIIGRANDRAFIVAGAAKADLLADLQAEIVKRATDGAGLQAFRKDFKPIVAKHGWTGWTGEGSKEGEAWRTRIIYQTNMATSYAAGRHAQMSDPEVLKLHPYWRYLHSDGVLSPREQHVAWHGLTLPASHPFWKSHYPPCGYGCQCRVSSVTRKEGEASERAGLGEPPKDWDKINPSTGEQQGIGKGFGYVPGANVNRPLQQFIDDKLIKLDAPIGAAMWEVLKPVLAMERQKAFADWVDAVTELGHSRNATHIAGVMQAAEITYLSQINKAPLTAEIAVEDRLLVGKKALRHEQDGDALTIDEWKSIPQALLNESKVYFDTIQQTLLYVMPSLTDNRSIRLVVEVNFVTGRPRKTLNLARSGFKLNIQALEDRTRYVEVR